MCLTETHKKVDDIKIVEDVKTEMGKIIIC